MKTLKQITLDRIQLCESNYKYWSEYNKKLKNKFESKVYGLGILREDENELLRLFNEGCYSSWHSSANYHIKEEEEMQLNNGTYDTQEPRE